jgi:peptidoglycan/xylan/chitin deacetylase (PgdA/CDA1 family)
VTAADFRRRRLRAGLVIIALAALALALVRGPGGGRSRPPTAGGSPTALIGRAGTAATAGGAAVAEARAVERTLAYTPYLSVGSHQRREIALTFDDGPGPATLGVLAILRRARVPATFFEIGRSARAYPAIARRVVAAGMAIGDHTESHALLPRLSAAGQQVEIAAAARDIQRLGAPYPRLFRPPYGGFDAVTLALLRAAGMLMVLWAVDSKDFTRPGAKRIIYTAVSGARPGAVILFHDGGGDRSQTLAAVPQIIAALRARGYALRTVPELLGYPTLYA